MTEEEFLALINLVEFVRVNLNYDYFDEDVLDKNLATVKEFIKRQGDLYVKVQRSMVFLRR